MDILLSTSELYFSVHPQPSTIDELFMSVALGGGTGFPHLEIVGLW